MEVHNAMPVYEPYVDARAAARFLGMHWKTIQRLARQHSLPAYPFSGTQRMQWKFRISELDKWAKSRLFSNCHSCRNT
jgi:excisionase family DNA binding protein